MEVANAQLDLLTSAQDKSTKRLYATLDTFINSIETVVSSIEQESVTEQQAKMQVLQLGNSLKKQRFPKRATESRKEFRSSLSRLGKALDKIPCNTIPTQNEWAIEQQLVHKAIAQHFCHEGKFDLCTTFVEESKLDENHFTQEPYSGMHNILQDIDNNNLEVILNWSESNSAFLLKRESDLLFKIRHIQFLEIMQTGNKMDAVRHSQQNLGQFSGKYLREIKELMLLLVRPSDLSTKSLYSQIKNIFTEDYCALHRIPKHSLLYSTTMVGAMSLPGLIKMAKLKDLKSWVELERLPVEIELPPEFHYHSVFICPVSKENTTNSNPPVRLSCGHAISKSSMQDLSKFETAQFKCPYCQTDQTSSRCQPLYL